MVEKVGVIGVGRMGREMTRHLISKEFEVKVYDVDPQNLQSAIALGAQSSPDLKTLAADTDCTIIMVATDEQVENVVAGDDGLLQGAQPGHVVVVSSTVNLNVCKKLAEIAQKQNIHVLDAPVVFGMEGATNGTLKSLVGGSEVALDQVRPVLNAFCEDVIYMGESGKGQLTKTLNNLLHWTMIVANYEVLSLCKKYDIHPARMREVLLQCPSKNSSLERWLQHRITWPQKDLNIAMDLAQDSNLPMPLHGLVKQLIMQLNPDMTHGLILENIENK